MVCRRDAENKLLSFPQDDCKEKMKDEFASSKVIKLVINDVVKWWRIFKKKKKKSPTIETKCMNHSVGL